MSLTRWLTSSTLAAALATGAAFAPAPAQANDDLIRVIVDVADVVFRSGQPYYRHGGYGYNDRLIVQRDRYGRPIYYRYAPRDYDRYGPPYGNAYGYHRNHHRHGDRYDNRSQRRICDKRGRCRVEYYDPRYDRRDDYYGHYRHDRDWDRRYWKRDDD
jgi:hypothetical protein